jgi:putative spermidine/putrescine transport system ATP-binding protein
MAELSLIKIGKQYGDRDIIKDLDLHVASGEMVCLLGPSGSGKTTTLRMIGGFISASSGQITIDGKDVTHVSPEHRPTAMVFQQYALWPNMTVFQNISFGLKLRRLSRSAIARKVDEVLELVDLAGFERYYPAQLSGGQQQRVALARALVLEPKVLLLDEPLSNLDAQLRYKVREEIRDIQQRAGITTVFVTHDQDEALSVSDRIAVLSDGHIEQFDTPDKLYRNPQTSFVARFIGSMNVFRASVQNGMVYAAGRPAVPYDFATTECDRELEVAVRPEDIELTHESGATVGVHVTAEHDAGAQGSGQAGGGGAQGGSSHMTGAQGRVLRRIPRGHYAELMLETAIGTLRAFVSNHEPVSDTVTFRFQRVLVYEEQQLLASRRAEANRDEANGAAANGDKASRDDCRVVND